MGKVINELKSVIEQAILTVEKKRDLTLRRDRGEKIFIGWSSELTARHNRFDLDACSWMETTFVVAELLPGDTGASIAHFQEELEVSDLREFASSDMSSVFAQIKLAIEAFMQSISSVLSFKRR